MLKIISPSQNKTNPQYNFHRFIALHLASYIHYMVSDRNIFLHNYSVGPASSFLCWLKMSSLLYSKALYLLRSYFQLHLHHLVSIQSAHSTMSLQIKFVTKSREIPTIRQNGTDSLHERSSEFQRMNLPEANSASPTYSHLSSDKLHKFFNLNFFMGKT